MNQHIALRDLRCKPLGYVVGTESMIAYIKLQKVGWSLTSLFSTNTAISETSHTSKTYQLIFSVPILLVG